MCLLGGRELEKYNPSVAILVQVVSGNELPLRQRRAPLHRLDFTWDAETSFTLDWTVLSADKVAIPLPLPHVREQQGREQGYGWEQEISTLHGGARHCLNDAALCEIGSQKRLLPNERRRGRRARRHEQQGREQEQGQGREQGKDKGHGGTVGDRQASIR